jgi:uncharacterized protein (TIGR02118 family)
MIKMIAFVKKRKDLSRDQFIQLWVHENTKLSGILGMKGYRINVNLEPQPDDNEPPYDGTAEIWWDDEETMKNALNSEAGQRAGADIERFAESVEFTYTEEWVVI